MNAKCWIRKTHRWVSIIFLLLVAGIFAAQGLGQTPAEWVYLVPLVPLAALAMTGIYLFALPYARRRRGAHT